MKKILQLLFEHKTLSRSQAKEVLTNIGKGLYNEHEMTAFMTVFLMRSVTLQELMGFRDALLENCISVDLGTADTLDIVGTGGDGKNTFNISTLACFIVAGAGQKVTKHGNYGASSISGASNLMEQLGYKFKNDPTQLKKEVEEAGICFLHAPLFHPAMKAVANIRRNLGIRTFYNMLGPLVNPASPKYQVLGVYNLEMARIYNYMLQTTGQSFAIVHSLDGYDEVSLTNETKVITNEGEFLFDAHTLGKRRVDASAIHGGNSVEEAAKIFLNILNGKGTWAQNAVVIANAAVALHATGKYANYQEAYLAAVDSLESGKAKNCLTTLISLQAS